jgi:hypothetical protein
MVEGEVVARVSGMLGPIARAPSPESGPVLGEQSTPKEPIFGRVVGSVVADALALASMPWAATTRRRPAARLAESAEARREEGHT